MLDSYTYSTILCVCVCVYREYAETVGRKVRDVGMVVDLIFLNTEVSLSQALEDVGRAHTPFAIIITQQHQVHRSCTVNILFGTPQGTVPHPTPHPHLITSPSTFRLLWCSASWDPEYFRLGF